jgi:hypothetical protein
MSGLVALQVIRNTSPKTQVLILSGAKIDIRSDVRHAATAVLVTPEVMRKVEQIIEDELPKN